VQPNPFKGELGWRSADTLQAAIQYRLEFAYHPLSSPCHTRSQHTLGDSDVRASWTDGVEDCVRRLVAFSPVTKRPSQPRLSPVRVHNASTRLLVIAAKSPPFDAAAAAAATATAPPSAQPAAAHAQAKSDSSPRKPRSRKAAPAPAQQEEDWREHVLAGAMSKTTLVNRKRLNPNAPRPGTPKGDGPVLYWCSRDQRAADNWALLVRLPPPSF
jgi:hypothetical protein